MTRARPIAADGRSATKDFGEWHDKALSEPVVVSKYGRKSVVLMSVETFERLRSNYREVLDTADLDDALAGAIMNSDVPPDYRWDSDETDAPDALLGF